MAYSWYTSAYYYGGPCSYGCCDYFCTYNCNWYCRWYWQYGGQFISGKSSVAPYNTTTIPFVSSYYGDLISYQQSVET